MLFQCLNVSPFFLLIFFCKAVKCLVVCHINDIKKGAGEGERKVAVLRTKTFQFLREACSLNRRHNKMCNLDVGTTIGYARRSAKIPNVGLPFGTAKLRAPGCRNVVESNVFGTHFVFAASKLEKLEANGLQYLPSFRVKLSKPPR